MQPTESSRLRHRDRARSALAVAPAAGGRPPPPTPRPLVALAVARAGLLGVVLLVGVAIGLALGSHGGGTDAASPLDGVDAPRERSDARMSPGGGGAAVTGGPQGTADAWTAPVAERPAAAGAGGGRPARAVGEALGWIALGGGVDPMSNQVSMEQDLLLASEVLGARRRGVLLYGAGRGGTLVQVRDERPLADELTAALAALFDPRPERSVRYRPSVLVADGASGRAPLLEGMANAAAVTSSEPLLVYVAAHGDAGEKPRDNSIAFWGGDSLRVGDLATALDGQRSARPLLLVASSCFSGGFADIAFEHAEPTHGLAEVLRCGLFASTWDHEAAGCDPNPDRRVQESYGVHFLNALRHADRQGRQLPPNVLDLDGDGRISAAEAHARVRIASRSISVPTSSSERWLRQVAPPPGPERPLAMPEEDAVTAALGSALGTADQPAAVERQRALEERADQLDAALEQAEKQQDERWRALVLVLLERWPVLDDPWHPDFSATLAADRESIAAALRSSPAAVAYRTGEVEAERLALQFDALEIELALLERQVRAFDNRRLAARVNARGGADLERLQMLLKCERSWPPAR